MTQKEFIQQVTEQLKANPRKVLAGHGIQAAVLQKIIQRPDVMGRLAKILWSLKYAKKGAMGMKKQKNFVIKGYKTFPELNAKAREDVEAFIAGLDEKDAADFKNDENIVTILMTPDSKPLEAENVNDEIITGPSVMLKFDSAVRKEYKIPGGSYIVIMVGKSAVRPAEEKAAARTANRNARKNKVKKTAAKLRKELKHAAEVKLSILKKQRERLQEQAYNTRAQMQQDAALAAQLGGMSIVGANNSAAGTNAFRASLLNGLSADDKAIVKSATKMVAKGKNRAAKTLINSMDNAKIGMQLVFGTPAASTGDEIVKARKQALRAQIKKLTAANEQYLLDLNLAPNESKRRSIKSMISKNNSQIKKLRAQLGTYTNMSNKAKANKAAILQQVNAKIAENIEKGNTITQALNAALAKLDARPEQKQIIKQQIIQQVAEGLPIQYAAQQAIQDNYEQAVQQVPAGELSGNFDIQDIINAL